MRNLILVVLVATFAAFLMSSKISTSENDAQNELATAISNAKYANKSEHVLQAHLFLRHVVNCLVGTRSVAFDANAGDPCIGSGHGAINDYPGSKPDKKILTHALQDAEHGLATNNIHIIQNAASLTKQHLQQAKRTL